MVAAGTASPLPAAVSLSLLESWPLRMLKPLLVSTMGRGLSPEKKASFFYRFGPTEEVRMNVMDGLTCCCTLLSLLLLPLLSWMFFLISSPPSWSSPPFSLLPRHK